MYHVELHEASHRLRRLNLSEQELHARVLMPWARGESFEVGERTWSPQATSIRVLEGSEIPVGSLTMGRGWSVAQKQSAEVTERVLAAAREAVSGDAVSNAVMSEAALGRGVALAAQTDGAEAPAGTDVTLLADAFAMELLRRVDAAPMSLAAAWRAASERHPQLPADATLQLARRAVRSLAQARLVVLALGGRGEGASAEVDQERLDAVLAGVDPWTSESGPQSAWIARR